MVNRPWARRIIIAACGGPDPQAGQHAAADTAGSVAGCIPPGAPVITGAGVGGVRFHARAEAVRRRCDVVGETDLMLEGQRQTALQVALGEDTVPAEVVEEWIWRIRVTSSGLATADSLRVCTPLRRLATLPGASLYAGERQYFLIHL